MERVVEAAPAKINLFLHVTGKRADGYHLLESLVAFADFGDTLEIYPSDALALDIVGPFKDTLRHAPENNIVIKAATALRVHSGCMRGARMILQKNIPVGAGLGGGSADAAAALRGLQALWNISASPDLLRVLALSLGSDVPVCLESATAIMRGVGEKLSPVAWNVPAALLLINPRLPLATPDVFRRFDASFSAAMDLPSHIDSFADLMEILSRTHNALEAPAISLRPVIAEMLAALRSAPDCALARMSGSGATCFGLFESLPAAQAAAHQLQRHHPSWWVTAAALKYSHSV